MTAMARIGLVAVLQAITLVEGDLPTLSSMSALYLEGGDVRPTIPVMRVN